MPRVYAAAESWPSRELLTRRVVSLRMAGESECRIASSTNVSRWMVTRLLREHGHHIVLPGRVMPFFLPAASAERLAFTEKEAHAAGAHTVGGEVVGWWSKDCPARFRV